ncbi:protein unc-79 homolog [Mya arenaria]|uniref:protein unc-79 homolog n=1 Tax=Mya arenaria TaxID=6604 RepID=UPI0022E657A7|nr:protein unc-79 homolog [Mya arenaria]
MATTEAATFTSKVRNLRDYHYRVSNNLNPQPTGVDIASTLKFLSGRLLNILKDVPNIPAESYGPRQRDSVRLSVFPNMNYAGLYKAALSMIDLVPTIQSGNLELGESVLNVLGCLVPFLENDLLDSLPYTVASTLAIFPPTLHKDTIDLLCSNLLPMTLGFDGCSVPTYASESAAAIITMVFQHTDNGSYHSEILECFMSLKKDIIKDILSIVAYGPPSARAPAANLLFYYWPQLNPSLSDRRGMHYKYSAWPPVLCQREGCVNTGKCQAVEMCLNPSIQSREKPPPLYLCSDCAEILKKDHSDYMMEILLPMSHVATKCENKNCKTIRYNMAVSTCFSIECASQNGNRPIRYCATCNDECHGTGEGQDHVYHHSIGPIWSCTPEMQRYLMDAIIALLKEAQPLESKRMVEMGEEHRHRHGDDDDLFEVEEAGERKMLSRYGIWLLVELCTPREDIPIEMLGRLLGMLFQWFDATAYLPDDNVGNALERLKPEYICKWLREVNKTHFEVIVSCLLPHPVEYARVGGFWDTLATRTTQIKEGLNCFFCLVPYDIITYQIWDYVIPYWMEAIRTEVPTEDLHLLKVLLSKAFDIDMCSLPFMLDKMYHFVEVRFADPSAYVQEQALQWLQILSGLEIIIPLHTLFSMLKLGIKALQMIEPGEDEPICREPKSDLSRASPTGDVPPPLSPNKEEPQVVESFEIYERETEIILPCYIMMLDLVLKQLELQDSPRHLGIYNDTSKELMSLLTSMLSCPWDGTHSCETDQETVNCPFCQNIALWHNLASQVMQQFSPRDPCKIPNKEIPKVEDLASSAATSKESSSGESTHGGAAMELPDISYDTSQMTIHLQLFNVLLQELGSLKDTDALHSLLNSMKYLILHGECLNYSVNQYPDFLKFCLARKLIPNLWIQLQAKSSHVALECVPLLLHCLTLPTGADMLWKIVEENFSSDDWKERFAAVEKATVLARFMEPEQVMHNKTIKTGFAHIFCLLIGSLEDINAAVSQRTIQYLETVKATSIKCICQCLEFQFDAVISDRAMILHCTHLLSNILPDHSILSWEFFLARFDSLSLEAQIDLEATGDLAYPTEELAISINFIDLTSSDRESEHFLRKLNRARFALARTDSIRSVSKSVYGKPPYRRAVSVPVHLLTKSPIKDKDKEKQCLRQQSAPQFRLNRQQTSKFNLGNLSNSVFQGGYLKEFTDEESNFAALLQRAMDLEGVDRETVHQLVALLMKFMVKCNQENLLEDVQKTESIVLRHLNVLLGYNQSEKSFSVPPYKLRTSAVFNSFLSGACFVLDRNFELGNKILSITLLLLHYGPSPQRYASDYQPPNYTLWYLEPHARTSWLQTLLVILYKYQINTSPISAIVQTLVRIVVNTIEAQHHHCKTLPDDAMPPSTPNLPRHKDSAKISVNDLENILETETPPQSPPAVTEDVFIEMVRDSGTTTVKYSKAPTSSQGEAGAGDGKRNSSRGDDGRNSPATLEHVSETPVRRYRQKRSPRKLVHYLDNETTDSSDQHSEKQAKTKSERPISVEMKMVEQLEKFKKGEDKVTSPVREKAPPIRRVSAPRLDLTTPVSTYSKELTTSDISKTGQHSMSSRSTVTTADTTSMSLNQSEGTSKSPSQSEATNKSIIQSETSRDPLSEDVESAEESEKTQTTSDAESVGDPTKDKAKGGKKTSPRSKPGIKPNFRQRKSRKTGLTTIELQKKFPELAAEGMDTEKTTKSGRRMRKTDLLTKPVKKPMPNRHSENAMVERCGDCNAILEQYDDETIGMCVVVLATYIHREPSLATPMLLESLIAVSRIASSSPYTWQMETNVIIPGNSLSISRQFIRCCLHQLAPNGIFPMLFQSSFEDNQFLKSIAAALTDFSELPCHAAIHHLLEGLNNTRNLTAESIQVLLDNLATYMNSIVLESSAAMWTNILNQFDVFFRRLTEILPVPCDMTSVLKIITCLLKVNGINNAKHILEPFSKLVSIAVTTCTIQLNQVLDICSLGNRVFSRERDKLYLTRTVIFQLVQALKFKASLPDDNLLLMVQFVVLDAGGTIGSTNIVGDLGMLYHTHAHSLMSTYAAECMRQYLSDCVEFISDLHTISKLKTNMKGGCTALNEDTLGSLVKSGMAQFVALEITRGNGRDNRAIARYLPWLYHPPSTTQQGPKEFTDCIGHIRLMSWLLIGTLTHTAMTEGAACITCMPFPLDSSTFIAEHVLVILTGFAEQSNTSVNHMSSLFHAFFLCQLWTMYCESIAAMYNSTSENYVAASSTVMDFWARVTPGILQLLSHSKVLAELVNLHFLSLMEALQECNSSVLAKLFPMWTSILYAYHQQLPGHLQVRLQTVQNWQPPAPSSEQTCINSNILLTWLKRIQFRLGQIEVQCSCAATQFYSV